MACDQLQSCGSLTCLASSLGRFGQVRDEEWGRDLPLLDLYSIIVDAGKLSTFRKVSLIRTLVSASDLCNAISTHLILSLTFASPSTRFHRLTMSSLCRTLIVHPQISGHSVPVSLASSQFPSCRFSLPERHSSNWSPIIAITRSSQILSAMPFRRRMIHFPPVMFKGSSHTGRRMPVWNKR